MSSHVTAIAPIEDVIRDAAAVLLASPLQEMPPEGLRVGLDILDETSGEYTPAHLAEIPDNLTWFPGAEPWR